MADIELLDLIALGARLPVDTDHPITTGIKGDVLVIRLEPGRSYPPERHDHATETITALSGRFVIEAAGKTHSVTQGRALRIPPGLEHNWGADSNAVVLVHFGTPAQAGTAL